jgi:hypothetical protein
MGQAETLNKGWGMANGEILSYLSADDVLMKSAVSTSLRYLDEYPDAVMTYGDFYLIDDQASIIRRVNAPEFDYTKMVVEQACPPGPGVFFRRQAFLAAGFWDKNFKQIPDYEYWLRLGKEGEFQRIPVVLASFRVHTQSLTFSKTDIQRANEPVKAIEKFFYLKKVPNELFKKRFEALSSANIMTAQLHLRSGRYILGYYCAKKAFLLYPSIWTRGNALRRIISGFLNRPLYSLIIFINKIQRRLQPYKS